MQILTMQRHARPVDNIKPVLSAEDIQSIQRAVRDVHVDDAVQGYILDIVGATRTLPAVALGASPRASLNLLHASQAHAALQGRTYVKPDDVKILAPLVLGHRVVVRPDQRMRGATAAGCVQEAMGRVPVPVGS